MAESKSDCFAFKINAYSEKQAKSPACDINHLHRDSEQISAGTKEVASVQLIPLRPLDNEGEN